MYDESHLELFLVQEMRRDVDLAKGRMNKNKKRNLILDAHKIIKHLDPRLLRLYKLFNMDRVPKVFRHLIDESPSFSNLAS